MDLIQANKQQQQQRGSASQRLTSKKLTVRWHFSLKGSLFWKSPLWVPVVICLASVLATFYSLCTFTLTRKLCGNSQHMNFVYKWAWCIGTQIFYDFDRLSLVFVSNRRLCIHLLQALDRQKWAKLVIFPSKMHGSMMNRPYVYHFMWWWFWGQILRPSLCAEFKFCSCSVCYY